MYRRCKHVQVLVDTDFLVLVETLGLYINGYIDISRDTKCIDRPISRDIGFIDISRDIEYIYISRGSGYIYISRGTGYVDIC